MYKILLIDDEEIVRKGISSLINWEVYGYTLIGAAKNGQEGYDIILRERPQVVITDLKMPMLDGLELIAKINVELPETVFIILSGYGEFELAQEAMRYGVRYYLLKPCNEQEIIGVLQQIRQEFGQNRRETEINVRNKLIKKIMAYVEANIEQEDLSLKKLAHEVVHMDEGYLSKLFIKETGERFSRYLLRTRMNRAIELIEKGGDDRVYEIARGVGLGCNPQYFSHLFKRYTGYTPTEYKRGKLSP